MSFSIDCDCCSVSVKADLGKIDLNRIDITGRDLCDIVNEVARKAITEEIERQFRDEHSELVAAVAKYARATANKLDAEFSDEDAAEEY